jgi:hypothetical protein
MILLLRSGRLDCIDSERSASHGPAAVPGAAAADDRAEQAILLSRHGGIISNVFIARFQVPKTSLSNLINTLILFE